MKKRSGSLMAVAIGNHIQGYRGQMVQRDANGKERVVSGPCEHKHKTTGAARTCAVLHGPKV